MYHVPGQADWRIGASFVLRLRARCLLWQDKAARLREKYTGGRGVNETVTSEIDCVFMGRVSVTELIGGVVGRRGWVSCPWLSWPPSRS